MKLFFEFVNLIMFFLYYQEVPVMRKTFTYEAPGVRKVLVCAVICNIFVMNFHQMKIY